MEKAVVALPFERTTKRFHLYKTEVPDTVTPTIYVRKKVVGRLPPFDIRVTVEWEPREVEEETEG